MSALVVELPIRVSNARAPLRIGLAGGGTDLPAYSELHGAQVVNVAIDKFAEARIHDQDSAITFASTDLGVSVAVAIEDRERLHERFPLHTAAYLRFMKEFNRGDLIPIHLETRVDVPIGSGLGGSSSLTVCLVRAFAEHLRIWLSPADVARLAWRIERVDCGLMGGWQDHYAASFGGFNFLTSTKGRSVDVERLRVKRSFVRTFEDSLLLYFGGISQSSETQIRKQVEQIENADARVLATMHQMREQGAIMREAITLGDLSRVASIVRQGWVAKTSLATTVPDQDGQHAFRIAEAHGARAMKICGAGSNRFLMMLVDPRDRATMASHLAVECRGWTMTCRVDEVGAVSWTTD